MKLQKTYQVKIIRQYKNQLNWRLLKSVHLQKKINMKFLFVFIVFSTTFFGLSQLVTPPLSPKCNIEQQVGLTNFTITYSRPSVRERKIFGDLIAYDKVWRLGANENTKISFDDNVYIQGKEILAGTYAMYAAPGKKAWTIYLYKEHNNWGLPSTWDDTKVAFKGEFELESLSHTEVFTMNFTGLKSDGGTLQIAWEGVLVSIPFSLKTKDKVLSQINKVMDGPSGNDYYKASKFYLQEKMELKQALVWAEKACEMRPEAYWIVRNKALIEAELGDYKSAIKTAKVSMELAEKDGDDSYVIQNKNSISEWEKLQNK